MFTFPAIQTTRTSEEQKQKILDEIREFDSANVEMKDYEAVDILHAAETFLRVHFRGREELLERLVNETIEKNALRHYYTKKCF